MITKLPPKSNKKLKFKHEELEKYLAWSILSPKPVIFYVEELDEEIVIWKDFVVHKSALVAYLMSQYFRAPINLEIKNKVYFNFKKYIAKNILADATSVDHILRSGDSQNYWKLVINHFNQHIQELQEHTTPQECLKMLDIKDNDIVIFE